MDAVRLLDKLCKEMDERYAFLASHACKDIDAFNAKYLINKMPRLILVVDELADMMKSDYGKQVEKNLVRIAQKARACGIHMVLATQRPTKDVVTGLIKANIPCRVAMSVPSKVDSLVMLDRTGAENLMGNGDMLFLDGKNNKVIKRLQGGFIEDVEINHVIIPLIKENQPKDWEKINWDNVDLSEEEKMRYKE
jgi:S-DNA-T family DNA segregation ATPase FtsK/SpoIIIE